MAKGYWIGRVDVKNPEGYQPYAANNAAIFKKFGGRFVVRGGPFEAPEGTPRSRNVVIEFPDYATALACYRSPEYQANIKVRAPHSTADIVIIEGYDGPQPPIADIAAPCVAIPGAEKPENSMADMRLIVAGAGGRMGRTLVKAIAETPGLDAGRRHRRRGIAAARAGLRRAGGPAAEPRECDQRSAPRHAGGGRHHRFHRSGRDREACGARRRNRARPHHRHDRPVGGGRR